MKTKFANLVSTLGHPLLTVPLFTVVAVFDYEDPSKALLISTLVIGGVFIPLSVKMFRGVKSGDTQTSMFPYSISDKPGTSGQRDCYFFYVSSCGSPGNRKVSGW